MDKTQTIKKIIQNPKSIFAALLLLGLIAYGIHIPWMGFYWDDWPWIWFSHVMGPKGMLQIDIEHRPISGIVLWIGSLLAGENPLGWQIYNLALRILGAAAFGWSLQKLWPRHREQITWATLLFLIYPGFGQQFVAVNNSRHLFPLITFFLSLGFMHKANREQKRYWQFTSIALILSLITMFATEYYYGLALIRPLMLWLLLRSSVEHPLKTLKATIKAWLPYLIPLAGIFIWRYTISKNVNYQITLFNELSTSSDASLLQLPATGIQDILSSGLGVWLAIFQFPDPALFGSRTRLYYWAIILMTTICVLLYFAFLQSASRNKTWNIEALILGSGALIIAPIPFWVTGLDPRLIFPGDRLLLPMIFGACLALVAFLDLLISKREIKLLIFSLLIGLSTGVHYKNAIEYRRDWLHQIQFFQQLSWRIPALAENTAILSNELPTTYSTDNSLAAPLIWQYDPQFSSGDLSTYLFYIDLRFAEKATPLNINTPLSRTYRFFDFNSTPEKAIVIYHNPPACLRVVDESRHIYYPNLPNFIRDALPFSNLEQIITDESASLPLPDPLIVEPQTPDWCYYFEKADLARQRGDWHQAAEYSDLALGIGVADSAIKHVTEYVVFMESYAHTDQWKKAESLSFEAYQIDPLMTPMLCEAWERIEFETTSSAARDTLLDKINSQLNCSLY